MSIIYGNLEKHTIRKAINEATIIEESIQDLKDGAPYGKDKGEFKRLLKNLFKKKVKEKQKEYKTIEDKKESKLSDEELKVYQDKMKKDYQELLSTIKKTISKIKTTKQFKDECIKSSKEANKYLIDSEEPFKEGYIPNLTATDFEDDGHGYFIVEIIDDYQIIAISYRWILYWIVDYIEENFKEVYDKWDFDYGDGDEGCLYVDYAF